MYKIATVGIPTSSATSTATSDDGKSKEAPAAYMCAECQALFTSKALWEDHHCPEFIGRNKIRVRRDGAMLKEQLPLPPPPKDEKNGE